MPCGSRSGSRVTRIRARLTARRRPRPRAESSTRGTCGWPRCSPGRKEPRSSSSGWRSVWRSVGPPLWAPLRNQSHESNPSGRMLPAAERDDDTIAPPPPHPGLRYARIVLKLSGEALCGRDGGFGIDANVIRETATELAEVHALGVQIG